MSCPTTLRYGSSSWSFCPSPVPPQQSALKLRYVEQSHLLSLLDDTAIDRRYVRCNWHIVFDLQEAAVPHTMRLKGLADSIGDIDGAGKPAVAAGARVAASSAASGASAGARAGAGAAAAAAGDD